MRRTRGTKDNYVYLISVLLVALAFYTWHEAPTPTGATIENLDTQLVIKPQPMPFITMDEDGSAQLTVSDYFTDVEGDSLLYENSEVTGDLLLTYQHTAPTAAFTFDSSTIVLCDMDNATCQNATGTIEIGPRNATFGGDAPFVTGKFDAGLFVENITNIVANPGFETGDADVAVPSWTNHTNLTFKITNSSVIEGLQSANLTFIGETGTPSNVSANTSVSLEPDTEYTLSVYGKQDRSSSVVLTVALHVDGEILCSDTITSTSLERASCNATTPSSVTNAQINLSIDTTASNKSFIVDAIQIERANSAGPYAGDSKDAPTLNTTFLAENSTVEFWIQPQWNGTDNTTRVFLDAEPLLIGKSIGGEHRDYLLAGQYSSGWVNVVRYNISEWNAGENHHVRVLLSDRFGGLWLFVDGVLANRTGWTATGMIPTSTQIGIGASIPEVLNQSDAIFDEFRIYNRVLPPDGPVTINLTPMPDYNTDGTSGIDVVFNATDPRDEEFNIQNPIRITVTGVDDPAEIGVDEDGNEKERYPDDCQPDAYPISPLRCIWFNGTILDRDMYEDTNFSMNVSEFINDRDSGFSTLTFTLNNTPEYFTVYINDTPSTGNITFVPQRDFNNHEYFAIKVTDASGAISTTNSFLLNVLPVADNVTQIQSIGILNLTKNTQYAFSLKDYFNDSDDDVLFGYFGLGNTSFNISVNATTGNVTITPGYNFLGETTVNFTANDLTAGVKLQENVTLNVTALNETEITTVTLITPASPTNGTIPVNFVVYQSAGQTLNVTAEFRLDGDADSYPATGSSLVELASEQHTETRSATDDSRLESYLPNENFGSNNTLIVGTDSTKLYRSAMNFSLPSTSAEVIANATLRLYQVAASGEPRILGIYELNSTWLEGNITHNTAPVNSTGAVAAITVGSASEYKEWDITNTVKRWLNGSADNYGLLIRDINEPNSLGLHTFASSEYGSTVQPELAITYQGSPYTFQWDSIADLNYTNQDVLINLTVNENVSGVSDTFAVHNNHPPDINTSGQRSFTFYDNETITIDALSTLFFDIDNHTLSISSTFNSSQLNVTEETDVFGDNTTVTYGSGFQGVPDVTTTESDYTIVVFENSTSGTFSVQYARYNSAGAFVRSGTVFSSSNDQKQPRVASYQNKTIVAWREDTNNGDIMMAILDSEDSLEYNTTVSNAAARQHQPDVAANEGRITVTWVDDTSSGGTIMLQSFNMSGEAVTDAVTASENNNGSQPTISVNAYDGNVSVAWVRNSSLIETKFFNSTLSSITSTINVSENFSQYKADPSSVTFNGETRIVWADDRGVLNTSTILLATFAGTVKNTEQALFTDSNLRFNPDIIEDGDSNKYVVFERGAGVDSDIHYLKLNSSDVVQKEIAITQDTLLQVNPTITVDSDDRKFAVWQTENESDDVVAISFTGPTGRLIIGAAENFTGNATMNITASDSYNETQTSLNFTILFANDAPYIQDFTLNVDEDSINTTFNLTGYGSDEETPAGQLVWNVSQADNLTLVVMNGFNLSVTPASNFIGSVSVTFSLTDGNKTTTKTNTIEVANINDPPELNTTIPDQTFAIDNNKTLNLSNYFIDPDGDALTFSNSSSKNFTFVYDNDLVTLVPDSGFVGPDSVIFNATDGTNTTSSNNVTLTVTLTSNLVNTTVDGTYYNSTDLNVSGLDNTNLTHDVVADSTLTNLTSFNSNISDSVIIGGLINDSIILNSSLTRCTVKNSLVKGFVATDCTITDSTLDPDEPANLSGSTITNSTIMDSNVTNSNVTNLTTHNSDVDNSNITNAVFNDTQVYNATIIDDILYNGTLRFAGLTYYAAIDGPEHLYNLTNFAPTASFTSNSSIDENSNATMNASASDDPNLASTFLNDVLHYNWTFGDGSEANTSADTIQHEYTSSGTRTITLVVSDRFGLQSTATNSIDVGDVGGGGGSGSSGGGGGGGGRGRYASCNENWQCSDWTPCDSRTTKRTCVDVSNCGTDFSKPTEESICFESGPLPNCGDEIKNQGETGVDCGGPCAACYAPQEPQAPARVPVTPPPAPPVAEPPAKLPIGLPLIVGIIGSLGGFAVIVLVVVILVRKQDHSQLLAAEDFVFKASRRGEPDKLIRDKMIQQHWPKKVVNKAIYHSHVRGAASYAKTRLAEGAKPKQIEQELVKNGWRGRDAHRAVRDAQHPKKEQTSLAEKKPLQQQKRHLKTQPPQKQPPQLTKKL